MRADLVGPFILRLAVEWLASRLKYTDSIQSVGSLVPNRERQTLGGLGGGGGGEGTTHAGSTILFL